MDYTTLEPVDFIGNILSLRMTHWNRIRHYGLFKGEPVVFIGNVVSLCITHWNRTSHHGLYKGEPVVFIRSIVSSIYHTLEPNKPPWTIQLESL